jgi:hypothetical protein
MITTEKLNMNLQIFIPRLHGVASIKPGPTCSSMPKNKLHTGSPWKSSWRAKDELKSFICTYEEQLVTHLLM